MATPSTRTPVRIARGSYSNLNSSISDLGDGEIVYAEDQDKLYIKEGSSLVVLSQPAANPVFTGDVTINAQGDLRLADSDSSNYVGFQSPSTVTSNVLYTLPATDGSSGDQLTTDGSGALSWSAAVNVAAASLTGTTMAANVVTSSLTSVGTLTGLTVDGDVTFTGASSNGLWDKSANAFVANVTGNLTGNASGSSGSCTGNAASATYASAVTVADESSDTSCFPLFATAATGNLDVYSGSNLTFNSSSGALTATSFVGDLTGAVTGTASGNAVLTGSTNNQIVTVTGANAIQGEAKLTFDGATLDFAINNSQQGIKIGAVGNHIPLLSFDSDRTAAGDNVGQQKFFWDGTEVARIAGLSGGDTTNKDDGKLAFYTRASGSSLAASLTLDTDQSATFAGTVSDSKGDLRNIPANSKTAAYTLVAADAGKVIRNTTGGWTIPAATFTTQGMTVTLLNASGSAQNITASALTYLYNTADGANIKASTIALGARGMATVWFDGGDTGYIQSAALTIS